MRFEFHLPTQIIFGESGFENLIQIKNYGNRVLIITGGNSSKENKYLDKAIEILGSNEIFNFTYENVIKEPECKTVDDAISICKKNKCNVIIALGGGSVIDTAKAVSVGGVENSDIWDFLRPDSRRRVIRSSLPLITIPTTIGAYSSLNNIAYIKNSEIGYKTFMKSKYIFPKITILNPDLMKSLSNSQLIQGAFEIFCENLECIFMSENNMALLYAAESLKLLYYNLKNACDKRDISKYIENLTYASFLTGLATVAAGTSLLNTLTAPISTKFNITQIHALYKILPSYIIYNQDANNRILYNSFANISKMVESLRNFFEDKLETYKFKDIVLTPLDIDKLSEECSMMFYEKDDKTREEIKLKCKTIYENI